MNKRMLMLMVLLLATLAAAGGFKLGVKAEREQALFELSMACIQLGGLPLTVEDRRFPMCIPIEQPQQNKPRTFL